MAEFTLHGDEHLSDAILRYLRRHGGAVTREQLRPHIERSGIRSLRARLAAALADGSLVEVDGEHGPEFRLGPNGRAHVPLPAGFSWPPAPRSST